MYEGFLGIRPITSWKLQGLAPNQNPSAHFGSLPLKKIQCDYSCTITRGIQITIYTTVPLRHREMGLWTLLEGFLLLANALAILNEDRLLAPRGWSFQEFSGVKRNSFKGQIIGLIYAVQYLRVPLVLLNSLCIVVKLVFG